MSQAASQTPYSQASQATEAASTERKKKIFITGANGQTGMSVVKLFKDYKDAQIIAGVYAGSEKAKEAEKCIKECCGNAEIKAIDADDIEGLVAAFQDVDDLFIVPTATESKVAHARNYLRAAKKANVKFVLLLSMSGAEARNHVFADQFRDIEETLLASGLPAYCVLRSNFYMQNLLLYRDEIRAGSLPLPVRQGAFNPVDVDDVAEAAKAILTNCKAHIGKWYNITGPNSLTAPDMAAAISEACNTKVNWKDIPRAEVRAILQRQNVPAVEISGLLAFYEAVAKNEIAEQEQNDFQALCGHKPTSLQQFINKHRQEIAVA